MTKKNRHAAKPKRVAAEAPRIEASRSSIDVVSTSYHVTDADEIVKSSRIINIPNRNETVDKPMFSNQTFDNYAGMNYDRLAEEEAPVSEEAPKKKYKKTEPMKEWLDNRESFLSEFLRMEGLPDGKLYCARCKTSTSDSEAESIFRCTDCDSLDILCRECILYVHERNGLHNIEMWDVVGCFYSKTSLRLLGHKYQLGHPIGEACSAPEHGYSGTFTVLDINGVHNVNLNFCGCTTEQLRYLQILRFGWYPATVNMPRTAITLRLLRFFHLLSFESKSTVFEFTQTLHQLSDNTGMVLIKDRYREFLRMMRQYRNLKSLKRSGRGHSPNGAQGTSAGECAVICPACPYPGINLPDGWKDAPVEKQFLYRLFIGLDANFRMKRRMISSQAADPSLSNGWAYFVEEVDYKAFLREFGTLIIQDSSTCSNHDAVNKNRSLDGFSASGVGTCDDTRHDMKRPCSVGDLQKGERYVNMDYLFFASFKPAGRELAEVIVSYDIACQWSIKLWARMNSYPNWMHVDHADTTTFRFLIPKFHLPTHTRPCQTKFSFNFNKNVGRTDGEGVERGWARINPLAASTREMGPGSQRDTLDDHFGDQNWNKSTKMGKFEAVKEANDRTATHAEFTDGLSEKDVNEWIASLNAWEDDHQLTNPFEGTYKGISQKAIRLRLAEQEELDAASGTAFVMHEEISASRLLTMGLEFEIQQDRMLQDFTDMTLHATDDQKAKWKLRSTSLRLKITSWMEVQQMYIPGVYLLRVNHANKISNEGQEETAVYDIVLHLPSSIFPHTPCDKRLLELEWDLRYAQCMDLLDELRNALCLRAYVLLDKKRFQRGQRANTRSQGIVDRIRAKVERAAARYRKGQSAIEKLASYLEKVAWDNHLLQLKDGDIRSLSPEDFSASEGRRTVSWIWIHNVGEGSNDLNGRLHESLRIEWCKSRARRDRWVEEVELLQEECRRIHSFFDYRSNEWKHLCDDSDGTVGLLPKDLSLQLAEDDQEAPEGQPAGYTVVLEV
ncbi:hypothetical protein BDN70DRAFT_909315 [Pholiota conissans]|uniref:CxC2-like cysteine cluster KDZ transposase-associated domain-containing protein n=1 Tax=Pholiota conissans TaxID=109636 RepID=A0A9P6CTL0_9AGAR|nr:hypothetical protein BDN70DRAFT_909315 [Pholiota conissans]